MTTFVVGMIVIAQTSLDGKLTEITDTLTGLGRPLSILALVIAVLAVIVEPALPDWAKENKGAIRKVLFATLVLGLIPDLINLFMGA